jgi:hypothetical protein
MSEIHIEKIQKVLKKDTGSMGTNTPIHYIGSGWVGCGECDCAFKCNNGNDRCIRLQHVVENQNEKRI